MKLTDQEWLAVADLIDQGMELNGPDLERWLDRLPESCPVSKSVMRDLLLTETSQGAGSFLNRLPVLQETDKQESAPPADFAGRTVGPYRLIRKLGQGGMGVVWLGERADGILKRPVAIKLPHADVYGRRFIERFQREREILATLAHPHIGRLYDAGVTNEGEPFLALEYIEGTEIVNYCDSKQLGVRERLKLFLQVLSAVHYANSHLVIHRDLKPSNILVAGDGQVKLLDFGVAKLILADGANETNLTQMNRHPLTPSYASPEQITAQPVSTASDVYSLGVVLFELLSGERPYRRKDSSRASLEEAIMAGDIARPSQAVQNTEKARARAVSVKKLTAALKGDLDTIILKALSREPGRRYATADAFSQDIERYLNGEAVLARAESAWYRARKFAWRNRVGVAAVVAVILALAAGLTASLWQARKARRQAATSESVVRFMEGIFRLNSGGQADPVKARQTTVRQLLDISAAQLDTTLNNDPAAKLRLLKTLYDMYGDLDLWDKELELDRKRLKVARSAYGPSDPAVVEVLLDLADDSVNQDFLDQEKRAVLEASEILNKRRDYTSQLRAKLEASLADYYLNVDLRQALAHTEAGVRLTRAFPRSVVQANILQSSVYYEVAAGNYATAEAVSTEALSVAGSVPDANSMLPWTKKHLAEAQDGAEDLTASAQSYIDARSLARKYFGGQGVLTPLIDFAYADFLAGTSRIGQGIAVAGPARDRALQLSRQGIATSYLPLGVIEYGKTLIDYGRVEEGLDVFRQAEAMRNRFPEALRILNVHLFEERAAALIETGRYAEAKALLTETVAEQRRLNWEHTPGYNRTLSILTHLMSLTDRNTEALKLLGEYRVFSATPERVSRSKLEELLMRAEIALSSGDFSSAGQLAAAAGAEIVKSPNRPYLAIWEARAALVEGRAKLQSGEARAALPLLQRSVALRTELLDSASPALADADIALSDCYLDLRERKNASLLLARAKHIHSVHATLGDQYRKPLIDLERRFRVAQKTGHPESGPARSGRGLSAP